MKLYIGGVYQGQEELARAENPGLPCYPDFHEAIRRAVLESGCASNEVDSHPPRADAGQP